MNRISPGLLLFAFFGSLMSLAVIYGVKRSWEQKKSASVAPPSLRRVIVASVDLPEGRAIRGSDFMTLSMTNQQYESRNWPAIMMADGKQLLTRILSKPVKRGQPFEPDSFYPEGSGPDLTRELEPGLRAVSLDVTTVGLPAQATPGNSVDVIFRSEPSKDKSIPELTRTLVTGVMILAINDNSTVGLRTALDRKRETHTVILAIPAEEAMRLKAAEGRGMFSLVLRGKNDDLLGGTDYERSLSLADVLELPPPVAPAPKVEIVEPQPILTEVFRRGQRQVTTFSPDGYTRINPSQRATNSRNKGSSNPPVNNDPKSPTRLSDPNDIDATIDEQDSASDSGVDESNEDNTGTPYHSTPGPDSPNTTPGYSPKNEPGSTPKIRSRQQVNQTAVLNRK